MSLLNGAMDHQTRADELEQNARWLQGLDSEWAAVAYFYSAYHLVRACLLRDPIFADPARLKRVNVHLVPDDQNTTRHQGRRGNKPEFGINDLVLILYGREVSGPYHYLHLASVQVRYESRLRFPLDEVQERYDQFRTVESQGSLVCPTV